MTWFSRSLGNIVAGTGCILTFILEVNTERQGYAGLVSLSLLIHLIQRSPHRSGVLIAGYIFFASLVCARFIAEYSVLFYILLACLYSLIYFIIDYVITLMGRGIFPFLQILITFGLSEMTIGYLSTWTGINLPAIYVAYILPPAITSALVPFIGEIGTGMLTLGIAGWTVLKLHQQPQVALGTLGASILTLGALTVINNWRYIPHNTSSTLKLSIVQVNPERDEYTQSLTQPAQAKKLYTRYDQFLKKITDSELVVLPETFLPYLIGIKTLEDNQFFRIPTIFGINQRIKSPFNFGQTFNSVYLYDQGHFQLVKNKYLTIPVAEDKYTASRFSEAASVQGIWVATVICWEVLFPSYVQQVATNSQIIVVPSSNLFTASGLPSRFQSRAARLRALALGKYVIFTSPKGPSAIYAPTGRTVATLPFGASGSATKTISVPSQIPAIYSSHGQVLIIIFFSIVFVTLRFSRHPGRAIHPSRL